MADVGEELPECATFTLHLFPHFIGQLRPIADFPMRNATTKKVVVNASALGRPHYDAVTSIGDMRPKQSLKSIDYFLHDNIPLLSWRNC